MDAAGLDIGATDALSPLMGEEDTPAPEKGACAARDEALEPRPAGANAAGAAGAATNAGATGAPGAPGANGALGATALTAAFKLPAGSAGAWTLGAKAPAAGLMAGVAGVNAAKGLAATGAGAAMGLAAAGTGAAMGLVITAGAAMGVMFAAPGAAGACAG